MFIAVKAVYDRKSKSYRAEVVQNAEPLLVFSGYFIFDAGNGAHIRKAIADIRDVVEMERVAKSGK